MALSLSLSLLPLGKGWCVTSGVFSDDGISLSLRLSSRYYTFFLSAFEVNLYGGGQDVGSLTFFGNSFKYLQKILKIYTRSYATVHVAIIRDDSQIHLGRGTRQINTRA